MSQDVASLEFIQNLKALPFVEAVYLFGSRSRGDGQSRSDIDLAIKMISGQEMDNWCKVIDIIDNADTLLEIDCINLNEAPQRLCERVYAQGKKL